MASVKSLRNRFVSLVCDKDQLAASSPHAASLARGTFEFLSSVYRSRAYYDLDYLSQLLEYFDLHEELIKSYAYEHEFALWMVRAIIDKNTTATENMNKNLSFFDSLRFVFGLPWACSRISRAHSSISKLWFYGRRESLTPSARLLRDIDMVGMAVPEKDFMVGMFKRQDDYASGVMRVYLNERLRVLRGILSGGNIYWLPWFQARFDGAARRNLQKEYDYLIKRDRKFDRSGYMKVEG